MFVFVMCAAFALTACDKKVIEQIPAENDSITVVDSTITKEVKDSVNKEATKEVKTPAAPAEK